MMTIIDQSVKSQTQRANGSFKQTIAIAHGAPVIFADLPVRQLPENYGKQVEELKTTLVKKFNTEYSGLDRRLLKQAVNEAHALAALTFVPMLVLPSLAEEKVQTLAAWTARQRFLRAAKSEAQPVWRSAVEDILKPALRRAFKCNSYEAA